MSTLSKFKKLLSGSTTILPGAAGGPAQPLMGSAHTHDHAHDDEDEDGGHHCGCGHSH